MKSSPFPGAMPQNSGACSVCEPPLSVSATPAGLRVLRMPAHGADPRQTAVRPAVTSPTGQRHIGRHPHLTKERAGR